MRKALSLIELIFTIVIIALVFTVIPKMIFAINKSDKFTIKQEAFFNGVSMLHMISTLSWDENNTNSNDILHVSPESKLQDCNSTTHYRVGGFVGSRSCEDNKSASIIGDDGEGDYRLFNDVDDFDGYDINASYYGLGIRVRYIDDTVVYDPSRQSAVIVLENSEANNSTNFKLIDINVTYQGKRGKKGTNIAQFHYVSSNIGQMFLYKRSW